jgi:site-specific DNA-methyltransferase (cytosine-N4-specific)
VQTGPEIQEDTAARFPRKLIRSFHKTRLGEMMWGDSRAWLLNVAKAGSVDLIMTSPPFGLVRKKNYGNEDADQYCNWFRPFAEGFRRVLSDQGSLVIDIGGSWIPGQPTRSLYHFKLLVMLVEEFGFHLCQEHYWWNPSKLPSPAEWVNIRRVRVKDAVNSIWWLSKSPFPKASNRRVLQPYSKSMHDLLANGYVAKLRPSGHDISEKFSRDNGGSVPPNLLAVANTESNGRYQDYCREKNLPIHPARFPAALPEYFVRMLTDAGGLVVDPFAGSCVTGAVAEVLERKWVCCELDEQYLEGAMARFTPRVQPLPNGRDVIYQISPPCPLPLDLAHKLPADGGRGRPPETGKPFKQAVTPRVEVSNEHAQPTQRVARAE